MLNDTRRTLAAAGSDGRSSGVARIKASSNHQTPFMQTQSARYVAV